MLPPWVQGICHPHGSTFKSFDIGQGCCAIAEITGAPEVDAAIDAVGFEARGHSGGEQPAIVLNQMMEITRVAGGIGIPGLYVTEDPGAEDKAA